MLFTHVGNTSTVILNLNTVSVCVWQDLCKHKKYGLFFDASLSCYVFILEQELCWTSGSGSEAGKISGKKNSFQFQFLS